MKKRNLDGVYFRIERDGKYDNICFSDLTQEERDTVCEGRSAEWLKSLANIMADRLRELGDTLDIYSGVIEADEQEE